MGNEIPQKFNNALNESIFALQNRLTEFENNPIDDEDGQLNNSRIYQFNPKLAGQDDGQFEILHPRITERLNRYEN